MAPSGLACATDDDCAPVVTGSVCPGYVPTVGSKIGTLCPNAAANRAGVAANAAQLAAIPHGDDAGFDFCDALSGTPRCIAGQCLMCGPNDYGPAACFADGATGTDRAEASVRPEAVPTVPDLR
jgi:hypothetical protein